MARYHVRLSREAQIEWDRLAPNPKSNANRYRKRLGSGPYMQESIQLELSDRTDIWRIEFGDWRIVFRLDEPNRVIEITRIRRRAVAYIGLERPSRR